MAIYYTKPTLYSLRAKLRPLRSAPYRNWIFVSFSKKEKIPQKFVLVVVNKIGSSEIARPFNRVKYIRISRESSISHITYYYSNIPLRRGILLQQGGGLRTRWWMVANLGDQIPVACSPSTTWTHVIPSHRKYHTRWFIRPLWFLAYRWKWNVESYVKIIYARNCWWCNSGKGYKN